MRFLRIFVFMIVSTEIVTLAQFSDPPNDNFSDSILISTNVFSETVCYSCGTLESAEPVSMLGPRNHTIWYSFVPKANGRVEVQTGTGHESWDYTIFTGGELASLQEVNTFQPHVLEEGRIYHFRLQSSHDVQAVGKFSFRFVAQPLDDNFAAAPVIEGDRVEYFTDTSAATSELGEPSGSPSFRSTWRTWIPSSSGLASLRIPTVRSWVPGLKGTAPWPYRIVYSGDTVDTLTSVPTIPMHDEVVVFWVDAGKAYRICIAYTDSIFLSEPLRVLMDVGQLMFSSPADHAVLTMPEYPRFGFTGPLLTNPATRIELIEHVSYSIGPAGVRYNVLNRGLATYPDFTIHGTNFPPYRHQVFARATTPDGEIAYSLPLRFESRYHLVTPRLTIANSEPWVSLDSWQQTNQRVVLETSVDLNSWAEVTTFSTNSPPVYNTPKFYMQQFFRSVVRP